MKLVKPPIVDPSLDSFCDGMGVLSLNGDPAGHIATTVWTFWSPFSPLRMQWWIWYIVVWSDGTRERSEEDYPPWTAVDEMRQGYFDWEPADSSGKIRYDFTWLEPEDAAAVRAELGVTADDF